MYKPNVVFGLPAGRKLRKLDFRAPEDQLASEETAEPLARSPKVDRWIETFFAADAEGDDHARATALQGVIDTHRADHAAAGVPVYAHAPLPDDFAERVFRPVADLPEDRRKAVLKSLVAEIEPGAKGLVTQQLNAKTASRGCAIALSDQRLDPDSPEARKRADELDEEDPIAAAAHPLAYGFDAAMDDIAGEHGPLGDLGWRRTIPKPSGEISGAAGEAMRLYLEMFPPVRIAGGLAGATARAKYAIVRMGGQALVGGALSLAAEWAASRHKPPKDQPSRDQYAVVFLGGAISGANLKRDKPLYEAFVAISTSIGTDLVAGDPVSVPGAVGAGLAALAMSKLGSKSDQLRLFSQGSGRIARKFGEKYIKEFVTEIFGDAFEFTAEELEELWRGFDEMIMSRLK